MKAVVAAFNQEKALVGVFSVITNLRMELFEALVSVCPQHRADAADLQSPARNAADLERGSADDPAVVALHPGHHDGGGRLPRHHQPHGQEGDGAKRHHKGDCPLPIQVHSITTGRLIHSLRRFLSVQSEVSLSEGRISEGQKAGQSVCHDHSELLQPPVPDLGSLRGFHHAHALQVDIYNNL